MRSDKLALVAKAGLPLGSNLKLSSHNAISRCNSMVSYDIFGRALGLAGREDSCFARFALLLHSAPCPATRQQQVSERVTAVLCSECWMCATLANFTSLFAE